MASKEEHLVPSRTRRNRGKPVSGKRERCSIESFPTVVTVGDTRLASGGSLTGHSKQWRRCLRLIFLGSLRSVCFHCQRQIFTPTQKQSATSVVHSLPPHLIVVGVLGSTEHAFGPSWVDFTPVLVRTTAELRYNLTPFKDKPLLRLSADAKQSRWMLTASPLG